MHTFQPYPIELVEMNPFTKISKEWALVSAGNKKQYNTMTVSWGGLGELWGKHVAYIFIRESRYTKELIDTGDFFTVSFLNEKYRDALNYCGKSSGRALEDKFSEAGLTAAFRHGIPYPDEANFVIMCKKMAAVKITDENFLDSEIKTRWYSGADADNYHTMYVGEIIDVMAR